MKAYQVFQGMSRDEAVRVLDALRKETPGVYTQAVGAACAALKARPQFLMKQPREKRAHLVRQALSKVATNPVAEEVLAAYFLEVRNPLLCEWLDTLGLEHEEGVLNDDPPCPSDADIEKALATFRKDEDAEDRELLLRAFAAQSLIEWPSLEARLAARD